MSPWTPRDPSRPLSKTANSLRFDGKESSWTGFKLSLGAVLKQDDVEQAYKYEAPLLSKQGQERAIKLQKQAREQLLTASSNDPHALYEDALFQGEDTADANTAHSSEQVPLYSTRTRSATLSAAAEAAQASAEVAEALPTRLIYHLF